MKRGFDLSYLTEEWRKVLDLTLDHLQLTLLAIGLALLIAAPLGMAAARFRWLTFPVLGLLSALYTVPSLAFLVFLIPSLGIGREPTLVALVAYAQIFVVRNIVAGLRGVDPPTLEAAAGIGMTPWQVFRRVRLPLALPVILAGVRTALTTTIGLATLAATTDAGGLGTLLFDGIARAYNAMILAGAIAIAALAIAIDLVMRLLERLTPLARAERARGG